MSSKKETNPNISHDARSNFGKRGWWIVIFSLLMWTVVCAMTNVSLNIVVPAKAEVIGVDQGVLLTWSTPAKLISLVVTLFFAKLAEKKGVKLANGILLILSVVFIAFWGSSTTETMYALGLILMYSTVSTIELTGGNLFISNWFPRKKGIAIGWATMGAPLASLVGASLLMKLSGRFGGIDKALYIIAGFVAVLAILNFTTIKNYPEECGCYPDNDPNSPKREEMVLHTGWTWKKVLAVKETWLLGIANGLIGISTFCLVTTLVPMMVMKGYGENAGLLALTLCAILGFVGSYLFGYLDQRWGTKPAVILLSVIILGGIAFFFIPGCIWVFVVINACLTGATSNVPLSTTVSVFGRDGSQIALPIISVIKNALIAFSYGIMGISLSKTGSYGAGWIIVAVLTAIMLVLFLICNFNQKKDPIENG